MTFPTVQSVTDSNDVARNGPQAVMPGTVNAGDLLLCVSICAQKDLTAAKPSGWTLLDQDNFGNTFTTINFAKIADGTEGGTTAGGTATGANFWSSRTFRITGWSGSLSDIKHPGVTFTSTNTITPPSATTGGSSADNLFIVVLDTRGTLSSYPTSYSSDQGSASGHGSTIYAATQKITSASNSPGAFGLTGATSNFAYTLIVQPGAAAKTATGAASLIALSAQGTGIKGTFATGAAALIKLAAQGAGIKGAFGSGVVTIIKLSASGVGGPRSPGTGSAALHPLTAQGAASATVIYGSGALTLMAIQIHAVGAFHFVAQLPFTLQQSFMKEDFLKILSSETVDFILREMAVTDALPKGFEIVENLPTPMEVMDSSPMILSLKDTELA